MIKLLLAAALLPSFASAQDADRWDARLSSVAGDVTVYTAEHPEGAPGEADMPLEEGDRVETADGATAELSYDGEAVVGIESNSKVAVSATNKAAGELSLLLGAIAAKFNTLAAGRQFKVKTPTAVAAVRGTEFGVEVEGEDTHVGVFDEGKVSVADQQGREEIVPANHETSVVRGQAPAKAVALRRFARRRALMGRLRGRHARLRRVWKALPPEKRRELRQQRLQKMMERRAKLQQRLEKRNERIREREQRREERQEKRRNFRRGGRR